MTDPKKDIGANDVRLADVLSYVAENVGAKKISVSCFIQ
jgi:hypothetical protein